MLGVCATRFAGKRPASNNRNERKQCLKLIGKNLSQNELPLGVRQDCDGEMKKGFMKIVEAHENLRVNAPPGLIQTGIRARYRLNDDLAFFHVHDEIRRRLP